MPILTICPRERVCVGGWGGGGTRQVDWLTIKPDQVVVGERTCTLAKEKQASQAATLTKYEGKSGGGYSGFLLVHEAPLSHVITFIKFHYHMALCKDKRTVTNPAHCPAYKPVGHSKNTHSCMDKIPRFVVTCCRQVTGGRKGKTTTAIFRQTFV